MAGGSVVCGSALMAKTHVICERGSRGFGRRWTFQQNGAARASRGYPLIARLARSLRSNA
jgi:hypothetical protein